MYASHFAKRTVHTHGHLLVAGLAAIGVAVPAGRAAPPYEITDLGVLAFNVHVGPPTERRVAINDLGQVVGEFASGDLWDNGSWVDLDIPGRLCDINNAGQMIGNFRVFVSPTIIRTTSFVYENGSWVDLEAPVAIAINDVGQVLTLHGMWQAGALILFPDSDYGGYGLNDLGQAVGFIAGGLYEPDRVFIWDNGAVTNLGTLGYDEARGADINNAGQIVGMVVGSPFYQSAMLWQQGETTLLGGSVGWAVNDIGQVVGWRFLWENGVYYDLNALLPAGSGWELQQAHDINNNGWIVGHGLFAGERHGFLLKPVPEPATLMLVALCALLHSRSHTRN